MTLTLEQWKEILETVDLSNNDDIFEKIKKKLKEKHQEIQEWKEKNFNPDHLFDLQSTTNEKEYRVRLPASSGYIDAIATVNEKNADRSTLLHLAARYGHKDVVTALLEKGANVDEKDANGWTPLHLAARYGHKDVVIALLEKGANINEKDVDGCTPLHLAAYHGDKDIVTALLEKGANVEADGCTPLYIAVAIGNLEAAKLLIRYHFRYHLIANPNASIPDLPGITEYYQVVYASVGCHKVDHTAMRHEPYGFITPAPFLPYSVKQELLYYWDSCKVELNKMKEEDSDLYDFLTTQNINEQVRILTESNKVLDTSRDRLSVEYPIYSKDLTNKMEFAIFFSKNKEIINSLSKYYDTEIKVIDQAKSLFNHFMKEHVDSEVEIILPQLNFDTRELQFPTLKTLSFAQMINNHAGLPSEEVVNNSSNLGKGTLLSKKYVCGVGAVLGLSIAYLVGAITLTPIYAIAVFIAAAAIGSLVCYGIGKFCEKISEEKQKSHDMSAYAAIKNVLFGVSTIQYPEAQFKEV